MRRYEWHTWAATAAALIALAGVALADAGVLTDPAHGVSVQYPGSWSVAPQAFTNSFKLVNVPESEVDTTQPTARIKLFVEERRSHAEALQQLEELALGIGASSEAVVAIGGWPAIQFTHLEMRPQPSQGEPFADEKVTRITTAIAAGDLLVHVDASLPSDASTTLIDETKAIATGSCE